MNEQATFDALQKQFVVIDHSLFIMESDFAERARSVERINTLSGTYDEYYMAEPAFYGYIAHLKRCFDATIFFDFEIDGDQVTIYTQQVYEFELGVGTMKRHRY